MKRILCTLITYSLTATLIFAAPSPQLTAEGAILIEPTTKTILYGKNIHYPFYPASTTKVLTSLILADELDAMGTITKSADSVNSIPSDSSHIGLAIGDTYSYLDGLYAILLGSDNFVSHDMAIYNAGSINAFAAKMNAKAESLGAYESNFVNPHGYHDVNHYTTPYDLALITDAAFDSPLVESIAGTPTYQFEVLNDGSYLELTHPAAFFKESSAFYNPAILAAKTGYHTPAGRTLVAKAQFDDLELIAVIMKSDSIDRFSDINKLFDYGSNNFTLSSTTTGTPTLINTSYSSWATPYITRALSSRIFMPSTQNYMDAAQVSDFVYLLKKSYPMHNSPSLNMYIRQSHTPAFLSNSMLTPTQASSILNALASELHIDLPSNFVEARLLEQNIGPKAFITLEESIYLTLSFIDYSCIYTSHLPTRQAFL